MFTIPGHRWFITLLKPQYQFWTLSPALSWMQVELGPQGIDCVSLWPGVVYTEFVQSLPLGFRGIRHWILGCPILRQSLRNKRDIFDIVDGV